MRFPQARLLVFAKAPMPGAVKTRLAPALGARGAAELHARMVRYTVTTAVDADIAPVELHCSPGCDDVFFQQLGKRWNLRLRRQHGGDLGKRMEHAFRNALSRHPCAVLIGADCPAITAGYLAQAFNCLAEGKDAVLGPAEDGGYVLLGLRRVHRQLFDGISWGAASVLVDTRRRLIELGWHWHELETLWDVDCPDDVQRLSGSAQRHLVPAR